MSGTQMNPSRLPQARRRRAATVILRSNWKVKNEIKKFVCNRFNNGNSQGFHFNRKFLNRGLQLNQGFNRGLTVFNG